MCRLWVWVLAVRILLVEDDMALGEAVETGLRQQHLAVDWATTIAEAVELLAATDYDIACLDLGLPDGDGLELCRRMYEGDVIKPRRVLMLTARDAVEDRVVGLDAGADDYLVKPFKIAELAARIRALARRDDHQPGALTAGEVEIDLQRLTATRAGRDLELTGREFAVLRYLASRAGEVVSAQELLEHCWDAHADPFTTSVKVILSRVRTKLGPPPMIATVRGVGYRLETGR